MKYPPFIKYDKTGRYRKHFNEKYCQKPITTHDGIEVRFRKTIFDHCFFESSKRNRIKDRFSWKRAKRIDWIKTALEDPDSERYEGWDRDKKRYSNKRRVAVVKDNYIVVISISKNNKGKFITAYIADTKESLDKIKNSPEYK